MFQISSEGCSRARRTGMTSLLTILCLTGSLSIGGVAVAAGDVSAAVNGKGSLDVIGDAVGNQIVVGRTGGLDEYVVSGLSGTTVNGLPQVVLVATGDVRISMRGGDDRVRVDGLVPGNVSVRGGRGSDVLSLGCPVVGGDVTMTGGPGDDVIDIQDTLLTQDLRIRTGSGSDLVAFFFARVDGDTSIDTGPGADEVGAIESDFGGSVSVRTGPGDDSVAVVDAVVGGDLDVALGPASDTFDIGCTVVAGATHTNGGAGTDQLNDDATSTFTGGLTLRRFEILTGTPICTP